MSDPDEAGRRRRPRVRVVAAAAAVALAAPVAGCAAGGDSGTPTINLYYPPEQNLQKVVDNCNAQAGGRYEIVYRVLPRQADDQRVQMVRRLAAEDSGMDVLGLDVTWTQEFASADWIREWTGQDKAEVEQGTLAGPLETARYQDKLYGAPKNTNVQLLWYRKDLVPEPPKTWDQMISMAQDLKGQGKPYQVLTMGPSTRAWSSSTTPWRRAPAVGSSTRTARRPSWTRAPCGRWNSCVTSPRRA